MPIDLNIVPTFALVFFRLAGMMLFAPLFGSAKIPQRVKLFLTLIIAFAIVPGVEPIPLPGSLAEVTIGIAGELCFGLAMGMILSFTFIAIQWSGEIIGQQMGFNLGQVFDPQFGSQGSVIGDMYFMLALSIFLLIGGHRDMLRGVNASFEALPLLSVGVGGSMFDMLLGLLQGATVLAFTIAAPMLLTVLVVDLVLGLIGRTMPQMNVMAAGLSVRAAVGMVVVLVGLSLSARVMAGALMSSLDTAETVWTTSPD